MKKRHVDAQSRTATTRPQLTRDGFLLTHGPHPHHRSPATSVSYRSFVSSNKVASHVLAALQGYSAGPRPVPRSQHTALSQRIMARLGHHHGAAFVRESMLYSHDIATVEYNGNFHTGTDRKTAVPAQGRKVTVTPRGFILAMPQFVHRHRSRGSRSRCPHGDNHCRRTEIGRQQRNDGA